MKHPFGLPEAMLRSVPHRAGVAVHIAADKMPPGLAGESGEGQQADIDPKNK
jgi:hypothetical protein